MKIDKIYFDIDAILTSLQHELKKMKDVKEMFSIVFEKYGNVCEVLITASEQQYNDQNVGEDKLQWIEDYFPLGIKIHKTLKNEKKNLCTGRNCILVDKLIENIREWESYGGTGILLNTGVEVYEEIKSIEEIPELLAGAKKKNTQNVLLLALSTFIGKPESVSNLKNKSRYIFNDEKSSYSGCYIYQMEPVVQVLSKKMYEENDTLDRIVMLCSKETMKEKRILLVDCEKEISPLEFFKEQTGQWLNPELSDEEKFYPILVDENDPSKGIADAVKLLRNLNGEGMHLYFDNHGGFRGVQLIVEAILSLLKKETIEVTNFFNVKFDGTKSIIDSKDAEFRMFDFVSGINEFTNYGRIDSLRHYFEKEQRDKENDDLLEIISGIAEAIQLCDVQGFEENLNILTNFFHRDRKPVDNYLTLFYQNIEKDYGSLIYGDHNTLDEVEWCLEKGFYQQCLTLIEGKMPKELAVNGVMEWGKDLNEYAEKNRGHHEKNAYIFNCITGGSFLYCGKEEGKESEKKDNVIEKKLYGLIKEYNTNEGYRNEINGWKFSWKVKKLRIIDYENNKKYSVRFIYNEKSGEQQLYAFLVLHKALKTIRNRSNHAAQNGIRIPIANIKAAIETYICWGRSILEYGRQEKRKKNIKESRK